MAQSNTLGPDETLGTDGKTGSETLPEKKPQTEKVGVYDKIAEEALALKDGEGPSDEDSSAIIARIVEKLKEKNPLPEGASEEPLFELARKIFWNWQDEQRKKEKSGEEMMNDVEPESIM